MSARPHPLTAPSPVTPAVLATLPPRKPGESLYDRTLRVSREKNHWMARALRAEARDRRRAIAARRLLALVVFERDYARRQCDAARATLDRRDGVR